MRRLPYLMPMILNYYTSRETVDLASCYDSDRAIVVDLAKKRWVDGLFALGSTTTPRSFPEE